MSRDSMARERYPRNGAGADRRTARARPSRLLAVDGDDALLNRVVGSVGRLTRHDAAFGEAAGAVRITRAAFAEPKPTLLFERRVSGGKRREIDVDGKRPGLGIAGLEGPVVHAVVLEQGRHDVERHGGICVLSRRRASDRGRYARTTLGGVA